MSRLRMSNVQTLMLAAIYVPLETTEGLWGFLRSQLKKDEKILVGKANMWVN